MDAETGRLDWRERPLTDVVEKLVNVLDMLSGGIRMRVAMLNPL
jgi:hypothetical protein